jgi:hypothetical protein
MQECQGEATTYPLSNKNIKEELKTYMPLEVKNAYK